MKDSVAHFRRLFALLAMSLCTRLLSGCALSPVDADPLAIPRSLLDEEDLRRVEEVVDSEPLEILVQPVAVHSRLDVYRFLLEELPFTASVVRMLGKGKYEIFRRPPAAGESPTDRLRRERTYYLNDHDGMEVAVERIYEGPGKWIYYVWGKFSMIVEIKGRAVIVVNARERGDVLETTARVYLEAGPVVQSLPAIAEGIVRRKAVLFIDAARTVTEAAVASPNGLVQHLQGANEIDQAVLKEFERQLLAK